MTEVESPGAATKPSEEPHGLCEQWLHQPSQHGERNWTPWTDGQTYDEYCNRESPWCCPTVSSKALISAISSLLKTVAHTTIKNKLYSTHYGLVSAGSHLVNGGELAMAQTSA
ncbi:hypothetical protein H9Q72_004283 [Fusarium xylarioides]|uniref:Uncharacterized protein n=1 Tax=Fusarium xylarioides TaxID=221167 RepID=A0A9P7L7V7_9HYPO|nr:hypothetical protein H9Q70_007726 [Fusarium xylarioides]KAG5768036.1 hypothetical protein H9Q72_004283 [Fusarium xylarioides]KAG5779203.1 hypothetical protein H9Q73_007125 [Fusarium xylarioides]